MQFIDHGFVPWATAPLRVVPPISSRIDHDAAAMDVVGLAA
jgi:hypothetical protein